MARMRNLQTKNGRGLSVKNIMIWAMTCLS